MDPRIVILNGPAGVGKTTVSSQLAEFGQSSACIHGDDFRNYIVKREVQRVQTGLGYRNGACVANNFISGGYDLVIYEYVFEHSRYIPKFTEPISAVCSIHLVTLWAEMETIIGREQARVGREPLGQRVRDCYISMQGDLDNLGLIIDTEHVSPQEAASRIWDSITRGDGLVLQQVNALEH